MPTTATISLPGIFVHEPPALGTAFIENAAPFISRYWHSIVSMGGYWEAGFDIESLDIQLLKTWFATRLGYRIIETTASTVTWQGIIWEMRLTMNGVTWKIGLQDMYNAVQVEYTGPALTAVFTNAESIAKFGRKELLIEMPDATLAEANSAAQRKLELVAWPQPEAVSFGGNRATKLEVDCVGDVFTLQYKYLTALSVGLTVQVYIQNMLIADSEFVTAGNIAANAIATNTPANSQRLWETLKYYTELGDGTSPFSFRVYNGAKAYYKPLSSEPRYEWQGMAGLLNASGGTPSPWEVKPGVVRDGTQLQSLPPTGAFLTDGRDALVTKIKASQGSSIPQLSVESFNADEILDSMQQHLMWLAEGEGL